MSNFELVMHQNKMETQKRYLTRKIHIEKKMEEIPKQYEGDIRRYKEYCYSTGKVVGAGAMLNYLYIYIFDQPKKDVGTTFGSD